MPDDKRVAPGGDGRVRIGRPAGESRAPRVGDAGEWSDDDLAGAMRAEALQAATPRGRWHATYLGLAYRGAVQRALELADRAPVTVLKTDLWNECLGGDRDILGHLRVGRECRRVAVDRSLAACTGGRARLAGALVVGADIAALPFRTGSFDAVLDLSTLDHVAEDDMPRALGEYRRVLRGGGVLLVVFWQRSLLLRLRLLGKRLVGLSETRGQRYFPRDRVRAALAGGFALAYEFAVGLLLVAPYRLVGRLTAPVSSGPLTRFLDRLVELEQGHRTRRLALPLAGLCGVAAIRVTDAAGTAAGGAGGHRR